VRANHKYLKLGLIGVAATMLPLIGAGQAFADYAPQAGDVVGVGGDTPQYALQFGADGDYSGDAGYNQAGAYNRLVTFNATADINGRSAYGQGSSEANPNPLNPTDVLRAGTYPVQRVQSSGASITALLADTGTPETINFVFSATPPTAAQQTTAGNSSHNWQYLHVVQLGTDSVQIAANAVTNAPAGLSAADLLNIYTGGYTTWNQIPGNSAGSTATIIPLIPQSTSSIYKTLVADLKTANGGTAPVLAADVQTVEQNDPTAITSLGASAANAIVPFSSARLALWNDGYFHNPATAFPGGTVLTPGVALLSGTPGDGTVYNSPITDYVIFRQTDAASTSPFQPGGSLNWVQTLFSNPGGSAPFFAKPLGKSLVAASGVTPNYVDKGNYSVG
jgi:ABC-type phosphate transport system substrate-binding protein